MTDAQTKTIDLVARYYRAFNTGNVEGMLDCLGDHVVHDVNQGERRVGKEAFREFLAHMNRCYTEQAVDLLVMATDDGARAAAEFTILGAYQVTDEGLPEARGQTYRLPVGAFFEIENHRIVRVTNYYNLKDWVAQVEA
ncbi:ketosteroid isomerase-related protein [Microbaculum marinisediminis]|uniref:Nuclear transport factor 2 family protein n=1 Tax=Microbaculum marinisediminis TaxID=2931392 RepID=A0AAW5R768_9HYPH|nr:ketosteroid isomerase-related protein [Microbaculum sp. A6E488]MCT8974783.1 nuclear transport factor 2 family protein [Microbaculum sp. A6E488]